MMSLYRAQYTESYFPDTGPFDSGHFSALPAPVGLDVTLQTIIQGDCVLL